MVFIAVSTGEKFSLRGN